MAYREGSECCEKNVYIDNHDHELGHTKEYAEALFDLNKKLQHLTSYKQRPSKCIERMERKYFKLFQLVQMFLNIIALVLSIVAVVYATADVFVNKNEPEVINSSSQNLPVKCRDCFEDIFDSKHIHRHQQSLDSELPCCELKSSDLSKVIEKAKMSKTLNKELDRHIGSSSPVSAHKYLLSSEKAMNFSNVDHVTVNISTTTNEKNSNNHARGVTVKHDGIEILHSGLYYVYSSLFYLPKTNVSSEHFPYQTWFHYVYRTRPNSPAMSSVILRTVFTCCPSCSESKDSVYTGGFFHLKAGDIIQVCLSGQGIMGTDTVQDSSFLGLFLLASDSSS